MKRTAALILLNLTSLILGQTVSDLKLDEIINRFVRMTSEEQENSSLYDYFENIHEHPIDINSAGYAELNQLPVLDYYSIEKIINYRKRRKGFQSVTDLYKCGIRKEVAEMIMPFVSTGKRREFGKMNFGSLKTRSYGISKYPEMNESDFEGNNLKINNRIKLNYANMIYINALADKDAGEKSYADFYSYNISYRGNGFVKKVILGSYTVEFGQGLAVWSPYAFSKSADAVNSVVKHPRGISAYASSGENRFLYGGATEIDWDDFTLIPFYSIQKTSGVVDSSGFTSLNMSGLFRTSDEIAKKKNLTIRTEGLITGYQNRKKNILVKLLFMKNNFSRPFYSRLFPENLFNRQISVSGFFKIGFKRLRITGEVCATNGIVAYNYSAQFLISKYVNIISAFRYYPQDYFALFSNGFGERKNTNNEKGIYNGIRITTKFGRLNFYYDFNKTLFRTTTEPFPVKRNDYLVDYYSPRFSNGRFRLRYHRELKEHYLALENYDTKALTNIVTERFRFALYYNIGDQFRLTSQLDISAFRSAMKSETGYSLSEEIRSALFENVTLYGRIIFFETPGYDSRIYLYENDLNGVFNMGLFYGEGISEYILLRYEIVKGVNITAKYSEIYRPDWMIASGENIIQNVTDRRIAVEVETKIEK